MRAAGFFFLFCAGAVNATLLNTTIILDDGDGFSVEMPRLALGTWQYNATEVDEAVKNAFTAGFTHVDTANDYNNQVAVGAAIRAYADSVDGKVFLTTKIPACTVADADCKATAAGYIAENFDQLAMDSIDLLLIHFPPTGGCSSAKLCDMVRQSWEAMEDSAATGALRAVGVSNYCPSCLSCLDNSAFSDDAWAGRANARKPVINQVQLHVGMGADPGTPGIVSTDDARGIATQAYSPLGDGTDELITGSLVTTIGAAHNKTGAQVSLQWLNQNGHPVVTKSTSLAHLQQDNDLFDWMLTDEEMAQLSAATSPTGAYSFRCTE